MPPLRKCYHFWMASLLRTLCFDLGTSEVKRDWRLTREEMRIGWYALMSLRNSPNLRQGKYKKQMKQSFLFDGSLPSHFPPDNAKDVKENYAPNYSFWFARRYGEKSLSQGFNRGIFPVSWKEKWRCAKKASKMGVLTPLFLGNPPIWP